MLDISSSLEQLGVLFCVVGVCVVSVGGGWTGGAELGIALILALRSRVAISLTW